MNKDLKLIVNIALAVVIASGAVCIPILIAATGSDVVTFIKGDAEVWQYKLFSHYSTVATVVWFTLVITLEFFRFMFMWNNIEIEHKYDDRYPSKREVTKRIKETKRKYNIR